MYLHTVVYVPKFIVPFNPNVPSLSSSALKDLQTTTSLELKNKSQQHPDSLYLQTK